MNRSTQNNHNLSDDESESVINDLNNDKNSSNAKPTIETLLKDIKKQNHVFDRKINLLNQKMDQFTQKIDTHVDNIYASFTILVLLYIIVRIFI